MVNASCLQKVYASDLQEGFLQNAEFLRETLDEPANVPDKEARASAIRANRGCFGIRKGFAEVCEGNLAHVAPFVKLHLTREHPTEADDRLKPGLKRLFLRSCGALLRDPLCGPAKGNARDGAWGEGSHGTRGWVG